MASASAACALTGPESVTTTCVATGEITAARNAMCAAVSNTVSWYKPALKCGMDANWAAVAAET